MVPTRRWIRLAFELVEEERILIDLHLKLSSIAGELRVKLGGVGAHVSAAVFGN
jgi:hypothetical protein